MKNRILYYWQLVNNALAEAPAKFEETGIIPNIFVGHPKLSLIRA